MDETYIKVKGKWHYPYQAVDKEGKTIDFLLTTNREKLAAKRFLLKAINNDGDPEKITINPCLTRSLQNPSFFAPL
jgi:putative transposase